MMNSWMRLKAAKKPTRSISSATRVKNSDCVVSLDLYFPNSRSRFSSLVLLSFFLNLQKFWSWFLDSLLLLSFARRPASVTVVLSLSDIPWQPGSVSSLDGLPPLSFNYSLVDILLETVVSLDMSKNIWVTYSLSWPEASFLECYLSALQLAFFAV